MKTHVPGTNRSTGEIAQQERRKEAEQEHFRRKCHSLRISLGTSAIAEAETGTNESRIGCGEEE